MRLALPHLSSLAAAAFCLVSCYCHCRRYPDVIVHRLLQAALELQQQLQLPDNAELLTAPIAESAVPPEPVPVVAAPNGSSSTSQPPAAAAAAPATSAEAEDTDEATAEAAAGEADAIKSESAAALLAKHQLPDTKTLSKIAKHSNDTKYSARMASDASLKLYLCIMLKQQPVVTWAVVAGAGGDKFFTAYLPEFGFE
jgi:exoribonuclease R